MAHTPTDAHSAIPTKPAIVGSERPKIPGDNLIQEVRDPEALDRLSSVVGPSYNQGIMSSVVPKNLILAPLWQDPKRAANENHFIMQWADQVATANGFIRVIRTMEQSNVTAPNPKEEADSASGILRYHDLDIIMALSHAFLFRGEFIEMLQPDLLRWMGYSNLVTAPYRRIKAGLERLQTTQICMYGPKAPAKKGWFSLISKHSIHMDRGTGSLLQVQLNRTWTESITNATWQEVNLDAYAHLTRSFRPHGLARVIYCYLTAHRSSASKQEFMVSMEEMQELFSPRTKDGRRFRYPLKSPYNLLMAALKTLEKAGVVEGTDAPPGILAGKLVSKGIPRLSEVGIQSLLFINPWGGTAKPETAENDNAPPDNQVPLLPPPPEAELSGQVSPTTPVSVDDNSAQRDKDIHWLCNYSGLNPTAVTAALARGWTRPQIRHMLVIEMRQAEKAGKEIQNLGGFLNSILVKGDSTYYSVDALMQRRDIDIKDASEWFEKEVRKPALVMEEKRTKAQTEVAERASLPRPRTATPRSLATDTMAARQERYQRREYTDEEIAAIQEDRYIVDNDGTLRHKSDGRLV